jgi:hypothetical protein
MGFDNPPAEARRIFEERVQLIAWARCMSRFHPTEREVQDIETVGLLTLGDGTEYPVTIRIHDVPAGNDLEIPVPPATPVDDTEAWTDLEEGLPE